MRARRSHRNKTATASSKAVSWASCCSAFLVLTCVLAGCFKGAEASSYLDDFFLPGAKLAFNKLQQSLGGAIKSATGQAEPTPVGPTSLVSNLKQKVDNLTATTTTPATATPSSSIAPELTSQVSSQREPEGLDFVRIAPEEYDPASQSRLHNNKHHQTFVDQVASHQDKPQELITAASDASTKASKSSSSEDATTPPPQTTSTTTTSSIVADSKVATQVNSVSKNADQTKSEESESSVRQVEGGVSPGTSGSEAEVSVVSATESSLTDPTTTQQQQAQQELDDVQDGQSGGQNSAPAIDKDPPREQDKDAPILPGEQKNSAESDANVRLAEVRPPGNEQQPQPQEDLSGPPIVVVVGGVGGSESSPSTTTGPTAVVGQSSPDEPVLSPVPSESPSASTPSWKEAERDAVAAVDASINFGESPMNNLEDTCYDEYGNARFCEPEFENVAFEQTVEVSSECGNPPSRFCLAAAGAGSAASSALLAETAASPSSSPPPPPPIRNCHICDANHAKLRHPAAHLTDLNSARAPTCWVSAPQLNRPEQLGSDSSGQGEQDGQDNDNELASDPSSGFIFRKDNVTLTLNLNKKYEISYISMQFCSLKPDSLAIYKSDDYGKSWQPYQFYSSHCKRLYGGQLTASGGATFNATCSSLSGNPSSASSSQSISFSTIQKHHHQHLYSGHQQTMGAEQLQAAANALSDWQTATNIKIVLDRPQMGDQLAAARLVASPPNAQQQTNTINAVQQQQQPSSSSANSTSITNNNNNNSSTINQQLMGSGGDLTRPSDSYNYAISDLSIGARCKCNGHASQCVLTGGAGVGGSGEKRSLECDCRHNTAGPECERCAPFHFDRPWSRASHLDANPCQPCNCNGHSRKCKFDSELYRLSGKRSGGVCLNCQDNTTGRHCNYCSEGFTRDQTKPMSDKEACTPCDCHPLGSLGRVCNQTTGQCPCREGVIGLHCSQCAPGYQQSNSVNEPCIKLPEKEATYESSMTIIDIPDEQADLQQPAQVENGPTITTNDLPSLSPVDSSEGQLSPNRDRDNGHNQIKIPSNSYDTQPIINDNSINNNNLDLSEIGNSPTYNLNQPDELYTTEDSDSSQKPPVQVDSRLHHSRPDMGPYSRGGSKRRKGGPALDYHSPNARTHNNNNKDPYYNYNVQHNYQQHTISNPPKNNNNNDKTGILGPVQGDQLAPNSPDYQEYAQRYYANQNIGQVDSSTGLGHSSMQQQYQARNDRRFHSNNAASNKQHLQQEHAFSSGRHGYQHHRPINQLQNRGYDSPLLIENQQSHPILGNLDQEGIPLDGGMNSLIDDGELSVDDANFNRIMVDSRRMNNHISKINNRQNQLAINNGLQRQQQYGSNHNADLDALTGNELPIHQQASSCGECRESRRRSLTKALFCHLDYAIKVNIRSNSMSNDWTRYEVKILDIFKSPQQAAHSSLDSAAIASNQNKTSPNSETNNNSAKHAASLHHRLKLNSMHWIWVPTEDISCKCFARLRSGHNYLILGSVDSRGELLQLDRHGLALEWHSSLQERLGKHQRRLAKVHAEPSPVSNPASNNSGGTRSATTKALRGPPMNGSIFGKRSLVATYANGNNKRSRYQESTTANSNSNMNKKVDSAAKYYYQMQESAINQVADKKQTVEEYEDVITDIIEDFLAKNAEAEPEEASRAFCRMIVYECQQFLAKSQRKQRASFRN